MSTIDFIFRVGRFMGTIRSAYYQGKEIAKIVMKVYNESGVDIDLDVGL